MMTSYMGTSLITLFRQIESQLHSIYIDARNNRKFYTFPSCMESRTFLFSYFISQFRFCQSKERFLSKSARTYIFFLSRQGNQSIPSVQIGRKWFSNERVDSFTRRQVYLKFGGNLRCKWRKRELAITWLHLAELALRNLNHYFKSLLDKWKYYLLR